MQLPKFPLLSTIRLCEVQDGFLSGAFSSEDLVRTYLMRIEEVNDKVHAIVQLNPAAIETAKTLDEERKTQGPRGPWHGVPILIKDTIATVDMNNTCGSYSLYGASVSRDASVVKNLREAGVIILGKANLSQWGNFRSRDADNAHKSKSSNGWSATGGQTYGVYGPIQDPSGSSSGSCVATTLGLAFAALANETDGSIVCPAARSAVVGIKPTVGLTSRDLVFIVKRIGTVGVTARTVKDAASLLSIIAGKCPHDSATRSIPYDKIPDYTSVCKGTSMKGVRIGIPQNASRNPDGSIMDDVERTTLVQTATLLKKAGAEIVDDMEFSDYEQFLHEVESLKAVWFNSDWKALFENYVKDLTSNPQNIHTVSDLIEFTKRCPAEEYDSRGADAFIEARDSLDPADPRVEEAYRRVLKLAVEGGIKGAMDKHRLDTIIMPSSISYSLPGVTGYPIVSVPWGFYPDDHSPMWNGRHNLLRRGPGTPFGLSFIGLPFTEEKLIRYAYAFEQLTHVRNQGKHYIAPSTELSDVVGRESLR